MTKARDIADFKFENITDTGTEGTKVASGTTAQRGSTTGQWRYNTTTGKFEGRDNSGFKELDTAPTVTNVGATNITAAQIAANYDLAVTGTNFQSGATVKFIGNDATEYPSATVTLNSTTSITARVPTTVTNANEPFDVKVTNSNNLSGTLSDAFNVDAAPVWQTAAGNINNNIEDTAPSSTVHATVSATDPEGDTVTYSETTSNLSAAGFSLNSSNGQITGDPNDVSNDTTVSFTLRATSGSNTTDRNFSMTVKKGLLQSNLLAHYSFKSGDSYSGSGTTVTNLKTGTGMGNAILHNSPTYNSTDGTMAFNITNATQKQSMQVTQANFPNSISAMTVQMLIDFHDQNNVGGRSYIVDWRANSGSSGDWYWLYDYYGTNANNLSINVGGGEKQSTAPASVPGYGYLIHTAKLDSGGNVQWRVHSTDGTSNTNWRSPTSSNGSTLSNAEMLFMGLQHDSTNNDYWARGYIKQILVYDDILTDAEADANAAILGANY